jgi:hypothetical protein
MAWPSVLRHTSPGTNPGEITAPLTGLLKINPLANNKEKPANNTRLISAVILRRTSLRNINLFIKVFLKF